MSVLFEVKQIKKSYYQKSDAGRVEIPVLKGIDLEIQAGEMIAITGASGVGKSTLLHILGTLEKPDSGSVIYKPTEQNIFDFTEKGIADFRNRILGFIFQFHYLLPEFTALENVMMPAWIAGMGKKESEKHAKDLLDFVGLSHRFNHRPMELSGGEQQRVAIARSVVLKPKLLLADELTGNLDSVNSENVMNLLKDLNRVTGISVLLVTHDSHIASKTQRVLVMKDGLFV